MEQKKQIETAGIKPKLSEVNLKSSGLNLRWLLWLPAVAAALIVTLMLAALVFVSARSLQRLTPVQDHLQHIGRLHAIGLRMEEMLARDLQQGQPIDQTDLKEILEAIQSTTKASSKSPTGIISQVEVRQRLFSLEQLLGSTTNTPKEILFLASEQLRQIQNQERSLHRELVTVVARDSRLEYRLAMLLLLSLPLIIIATFFLLRNHIKQPLDDLNALLRRLASRDYRPVSEAQVSQIAGLIQPVYRSYNTLVTRLAELEAEHQALRSSLEHDVERATTALLEQAGELARSERLAAVGELSASLAHEIRNPLAGIQLACTKLGRQLSPDQQQKIDLIVNELKRLNNLLSERLVEARHVPESSVDVSVSDLIDNLVSLLNYQVPGRIRLHTEVEPDLHCLLPESGLRQSLLNLVMNAARAISEGEGQITLFAQRTGDRLEIGVRDTGPGFPQEMIDLGVRPFVTGRVEGTGLGLAIVLRYVRALFGDLRLENLPSGGACVTLSLPCQTSSEPQGDVVLEGENDA